MKAPSFQLYADDFVGGVADMTQSEVGAYILLLCHQWGKGEIPCEPARAALIAKGGVTDHVMSKFPNGKNPRLEKVRSERAQYIAGQSTFGHKGADKRWGRNGVAHRAPHHEPIGSPMGSPSKPQWGKDGSPSPSPSPSPSLTLTLSSNADGVGMEPTKSPKRDLLSEMEQMEAYKHINIRHEYQKMALWCSNKNKRPSERRFIAWCNRCEKPMDGPNGKHVNPHQVPASTADDHAVTDAEGRTGGW